MKSITYIHIQKDNPHEIPCFERYNHGNELPRINWPLPYCFTTTHKKLEKTKIGESQILIILKTVSQKRHGSVLPY